MKITDGLIKSHCARVRVAAAEALKGRTTGKTYAIWTGKYLGYVQRGKVADVRGFLDTLGREEFSRSSVRQAWFALNFYGVSVLGRPKLGFPPPKKIKHRRVFDVITRDEAIALIERLEPIHRLKAGLAFGAGLRNTEIFSLRVKDINLNAGVINVRSGKGGKDRVTNLPGPLRSSLAQQINAGRRKWEVDQKAGIFPGLEGAPLARKFGRALREDFGWQFLFPSARVTEGRRWHATEGGINAALRRAAKHLEIHKETGLHKLRHAFATSMLRGCVDIRTVQTLLGHASVETTEIYTHPVNAAAVPSPLDVVPIGEGTGAEPSEKVLPFPALKPAAGS